MRILIVTIYYPPVISSLSIMMQEVAEDLSIKGHDVTIATAKPQKDLSVTKDQLNISFDTFAIENKVSVIRVPTPPLKSNLYFLRGLVQFLLPYIFYNNILKYSPAGFDAVIISTPPLPLTKIGLMMKKKFKSKFILFVQDIYPQSLVDIQAMKNKTLIKFFERITQNAYNNADLITSHTEGNRDYIIKNNKVDEKKIFYLPNWIELKDFKKKYKINKYRKKYKLEKKFIFLFAGVIGLGQGIEKLISALTQTNKMPTDCSFLFVGEGSEKNKIEKIVNNSECENIVFKSFVPLEEYPDLVGEANVGIVCLDHRLSTPVVPGKLLGFMASSLPIIAFLNKNSDGHNIIKKANCGYSIDSNSSSEDIRKLFLKVYNNRNELRKMGKNGFEYASKHYDKDRCLDDIYDLLQKKL